MYPLRCIERAIEFILSTRQSYFAYDYTLKKEKEEK